VLVRVHAAGVDRGVWHLMTGLPYLTRLAFGLRAPKNPVPGMDVAGVVEAVGKNVTRFQPGDEVFGVGKGTFAEYALAREDKLAPKPANLTFEQAAVVAISGLTALQGLRDHGRVAPGQRVLIIGASGGVGTFAVQIAKAFGAHVTGVCSTTKVNLVRSIGADHVIDYTREDFAQGEHRYDLILDIGGSSPLSRLRRALTPRGNARHRRWRRGRTMARSSRPSTPSAPAVPVREPEAGHVHLQREPRGPDRPQGAHRIRQAHTGHRPHLSAERSPRGNPLSRRGPRPGESRHRRLTRGTALKLRVSRPPRRGQGNGHSLTSSTTRTTREGQQGTVPTTADVSLRRAAAVAGLGLLVMAVLGGTMFAAFENLVDSGG
jgi:hypothetical protein